MLRGLFVFCGHNPYCTMNTLFNDTQLFNSGELRIQQFDIPDAELILWEHFIPRDEADKFYTAIMNETPWKQEEITVYDKTHLTPRMTVWYGNRRTPGKPIRPLTPTLELIKQKVEVTSGIQFTSVLVNLYRDGKDGVGCHSLAYAMKKDFANGAKSLEQLEQAKDPDGSNTNSYLFLVYAAMGENDKAFDWIRKAIENKSSLLLLRFADPLVNPIKAGPRYPEFHKILYQ
jgi:hypothetical protein